MIAAQLFHLCENMHPHVSLTHRIGELVSFLVYFVVDCPFDSAVLIFNLLVII